MRPLAPIYRHLGLRLADLRAIAKLTQAQLAERIERSTEFVGKIERGETRVQLEDLAKLARVLNAPLEEVFRGLQSTAWRKLLAREGKRTRSESDTPDAVIALFQLASSLDDEDLAALSAVARRLVAARMAR